MSVRVLLAMALGGVDLLVVLSRWVMTTMGSSVGMFSTRPMMILLGLSGLLLVFTPRAAQPKESPLRPGAAGPAKE